VKRLDVPTEERCCRDVLQRLDVVIWEADPRTLQVGFVSQRAEQMLGHPQIEWLSDPGFLVRIVHSEDRGATVKLMRDVAADGQSRRSEIRMLAADGHEIWFRMEVYPADDQIPARRVRGLMLNITGQQEANERINVFLESAPDAIVVVDADGRMVMINHLTEEMFGFPRHELLGQTVELLVPARFHLRHVQHRQGYSKHPKTRPMGAGQNLLGRRKDGSEFPVEISLSPFETEQGTLITSIIRDITERKRAEALIQASLREKEVLLKDISRQKSFQEEIKQLNVELDGRVQERTRELLSANQELEAFSYSVSHDLRTPLRAVHGYIRILQEDYAPSLDAEGNRLLKVVATEALRMGDLIDDLLAFSRLGRQPMDVHPVDMTRLAAEVFQNIAANSPPPIPRFELKPLPSAQGDVAMLRQVFANLLGNAVKFTRGQRVPVIEVGADAGAGEVTYYVKDYGVGFDEQGSHRLFEVFQRLHSDEEFEGTGVGLALVRRVITRHGGGVRAEGKVNQGTTFYFTLPIRPDRLNSP
jgi:PAS domain S-box-containing protein